MNFDADSTQIKETLTDIFLGKRKSKSKRQTTIYLICNALEEKERRIQSMRKERSEYQKRCINTILRIFGKITMGDPYFFDHLTEEPNPYYYDEESSSTSSTESSQSDMGDDE